MIEEKEVFVLKRIKDKRAQTAKLNISDLLSPARFASQPDKKPPVKPPMPKHIILNPPCWRASVLTRLCIQVGSHENTAHRPISIVPKIMEPVTIARMLWG